MLEISCAKTVAFVSRRGEIGLEQLIAVSVANGILIYTLISQKPTIQNLFKILSCWKMQLGLRFGF